MSIKYSDLGLYRKLLLQARPYWIYILGIFLLDLLAAPIALLDPVPLKIAVDSVLGSEPLPGFLRALFPATVYSSGAVLVLAVSLLVGIALLRRLQGLGSSLLRTYTGERLVLDFRARLFRHAESLSLAYHDTEGTSDSLYRVLWDSSAIQAIAIDGVAPFLTATFTLISMFYVIFRIDWQLALVALAVAPALLLLGWLYRTRVRNQWHEVKTLESSAFSVAQEVLGAVRVVKAFGQEDREQKRFVDHSARSVGARLRTSFATQGFALLISMVTVVGTAIVLYVGVRHVQTGVITLGLLLIVISYLSRLYGPLETISKKVGSMQSSLTSAERAISLLDMSSDVPERPNARPLGRAIGAVEFRGVSFAYGKEQQVLRDISIDIPAGTRVGIAGKTGAGKTTLVSLLTRFYDPDTGQILLDGIDLRDYKLADLRNQFAIVLQEPVLFSTSIAENIAYARPDASEEEIVLAAKAANAHDFIVSIPDGYDTEVGERGMRLSGGERQRISLARAFLKDAPMLILDEPTSSVDMRTESAIVEAMERLMRNRTTFMIAHRLTTLERCDMLLMIDQGQLLDVRYDVRETVQKAVASGGLETVQA